jgi:hypothetical protein
VLKGMTYKSKKGKSIRTPGILFCERCKTSRPL